MRLRLEDIFSRIAHGDQDLPLRILLFRLMAFTVSLLCVGLVIPANLLQNLSQWLNVAVAVYAALAYGLYRLSLRGTHLYATFYILTLALLSFSWFLNGGSTGSINYFYVITIIFPISLFFSWRKLAMIALLVLNFSFLLFLEFRYPHLITPFTAAEDRIIDLLTGFAVSVVTLSTVFWVIVRGYNHRLAQHEKAEKELRESRDKLEWNIETLKKTESQLRHSQRLDSIGQLAGGIAHDFNNILSVIGGYASLLEETDNSPDNQIKIREINSAVEMASTLVRGLLAFSRKQSMDIRCYDLNMIVLDIQQFISRVIREDIRFEVYPAAAPLCINADRGELEQVLINLSTNARDAMPSGGELSIRLAEDRIDEAFVEAHGFGVPGSYAVAEIRDTGCGIDQAHINSIFDPFFTTKDVGKGTGLGLSIVYGIISQHNGFITVKSVPGSGTAFSVFLPLVPERQADSAGSGAQQENDDLRAHRPALILVVEDDAAVRRYVSSVLTAKGYRVIEAADGRQALEQFVLRPNDIDLVISDVVMPVLNGVDMAEKLLVLKPDIRLLFTSGYTPEVFRKKGGNSLAKFETLMKPVTPQRLAGKVREILDAD